MLRAGEWKVRLPRLQFALNHVESKWACAIPARVQCPRVFWRRRITPLGGIGQHTTTIS
jgi:hypothetical protein